jgi:uncharacterized phage protein (TIGR02216 family)
MTPREISCAIEAMGGRMADPLSREAFSALMQRFPDGR